MLLNSVRIGNAQLYNNDCLDVLKTLPDNHINLILTDPPYFRVKSENWDRQWSSDVEYLKWLDSVLAEFWRVLKPNGSLYMFCGSHLAAEIEILVKPRFNLLNHIVWAKPSGRWNGSHKEDFRKFYPSNERILFAEHYGADNNAKQKTGYYSKCEELKSHIFKPLIDYFRNAREKLGVSAKSINEATNTQMCSHWFSYSQWQLPSREQYSALQTLFRKTAIEKNLINELDCDHNFWVKKHDVLKREYDLLTTQYNDLKLQYENLRRPFHVTKNVPHIDVWSYKPVQFYPGKHPCEKPSEMIADIIRASSRPGDLIGDFFMGSGVVLKQSNKLGRHSIGVEIDEARFNQTVLEIKNLLGPRSHLE